MSRSVRTVLFHGQNVTFWPWNSTVFYCLWKCISWYTKFSGIIPVSCLVQPRRRNLWISDRTRYYCLWFYANLHRTLLRQISAFLPSTTNSAQCFVILSLTHQVFYLTYFLFHVPILYRPNKIISQSLLLRSLRLGSVTACFLGLRVRITPWTSTSVSCECSVSSSRSLPGEPVPRPEESYWVWFVWVWFRNLNNENA